MVCASWTLRKVQDYKSYKGWFITVQFDEIFAMRVGRRAYFDGIDV